MNGSVRFGLADWLLFVVIFCFKSALCAIYLTAGLPKNIFAYTMYLTRCIFYSLKWYKKIFFLNLIGQFKYI